MSAMKAETLKMRLSPQEFERLLINAFCLPEKCTDVNIHMRAGCPTTVVVEYILTPIQIEGDSVKKARMLLAQDTRMADWWRYGGWRRYM